MTKSNLKFLTIVLALILNPLATYADWKDCPKSISAKELIAWRKILIEKVLAGEKVLGVVEACFPETQPA